jgi:hypothetical protein
VVVEGASVEVAQETLVDLVEADSEAQAEEV